MTPSGTSIRFGLFDWLDRNAGSLADMYEQRLRLLEYADQAGYAIYHLAEHHGTPLGMAPSPNLFLAAAAQRTKRIRLGPLVYIVPLYNPMRLAEEICMLDQLSGGRLELGLGRGSSRFELQMLGVDVSETRERYDEGIDVLLEALSTGEVTHGGRYWTFDKARLELEPFQKPYPPLWYPSSIPETIPWIAEHGYNTLWSFNTPTQEEVHRRLALYTEHYPLARNNPKRVNPHVVHPTYGIVRKVYVADTDEEALRVAREALKRFRHNFSYLFELHEDHAHWNNLSDFDDCLARGVLFAGSPATVRETLSTFLSGTGGNYFGACFAWGDISTEQTLRSMELFTKEVIPAFS
jgi:alkanesulfonate monooxygenase SsuD/methylene tetrahydromethanopterin reductase-like flavin-dependent oxidoreductase (luciferase family)